jgi:hypothetical protein
MFNCVRRHPYEAPREHDDDDDDDGGGEMRSDRCGEDVESCLGYLAWTPPSNVCARRLLLLGRYGPIAAVGFHPENRGTDAIGHGPEGGGERAPLVFCVAGNDPRRPEAATRGRGADDRVVSVNSRPRRNEGGEE